MRILFLDWKCFNGMATQEAMREQGHVVLPFLHEGYRELACAEFTESFMSFCEKNTPELAFSYNYFPIVAECCHERGLPYISVVYDDPAVYLYSYTTMFPTNRVYIFDSKWVREFNAGGLKNVSYINLPADTKRLPQLQRRCRGEHACGVSFVGALYNEEHNFYERMEAKLSERMKGFLQGLMDAQSLIYGTDLITPSINHDIVTELHEALPLEPDPRSVEPENYRYVKYAIDRKLTSIERRRYLTALGERMPVDLYTLDAGVRIGGVTNRGIAEYETVMPEVFHESRINLNITLRSIDTGIPQRCMDIFSCGGFLLSNYQEDFFLDAVTEDGSAAFVPGVDYDYYSSVEELIDKCSYYLSHEDERHRIARSGYEKVKKYYSINDFLDRVLGEFTTKKP